MDTKFRFSISTLTVAVISILTIKASVIFKILQHSQTVDVIESIFTLTIIFTSVYSIISLINNNKRILNDKKRMEDILNESSLISKADARGKIIEVNDLFCSVSGYKRHELLGKDHKILNSGKHPTSFWQDMYESTILHKTIWNEVVTNKSKSGEEYIVNSWIKGIFNEKGKHIGFISTRQNITELHNSLITIKEKEEELRGTLQAINKSSAVIEYCTNGFIINTNTNFLELFEYPTLHEITGKHHSILLNEADNDLKIYERFWKELRAGNFKRKHVKYITKNKKNLWIHSTYNPIFDSSGKLTKIIEIMTDNTEILNQQIELERKNAYLEHAAKILRHDMHSGINTYIPRGISSLERRIDKLSKDNNMSKDQVEKIFGSSMKLIKEGLHHSQKVYSGVKEFTNLVKKDSQLDKYKVNLSDILKDYLKSTAYSSQVVISDLCEELVNPPLFCTAIDNLIRNGLKYNDSDSKIIKIYREDNNIIIEDNGRGMTRAEFEEYSKPYTRKMSNKESGTGLGLNICLAIIKEHGWHLDIGQKKNPGTKLVLHIK